MSKFKSAVVIPRDEAQKQIDMFLEYYDIDEAFIPEPLQGMMENHTLGLLKGVVRGRLSIEESGEGIKVILVPVKPISGENRLEFRELDGTALKASRLADSAEGTVFALLAALCKVPAEDLAEAHPKDQSLLKDLGNCFLMV